MANKFFKNFVAAAIAQRSDGRDQRKRNYLMVSHAHFDLLIGVKKAVKSQKIAKHYFI